MAQALYRNYRPKVFSDVLGQEHITKTLQNAIKSGKLSHAYLFTGPRGVGKTSVARILAHEVNSLPYSDESIHLDIIEIDAASNRRIDEIRDLRDRVRIAPASARYKVYIIDEVHMLTREAFNALLKTLEEPPDHCIFILATTEAHKLPETIISRTQRFEFKPISTPQASKHLESIAKRENIVISKPALELLAEFGRGSFRDSISYLDQLSSYNKEISEQAVRQILGQPAEQEIDGLMSCLASGDSAQLLAKLQSIEGSGVSPQAVAAAISERIRDNIRQKPAGLNQIKLLKQLLEVSASNRPQETLEIILLETCARNYQTGNPLRKSESKTDEQAGAAGRASRIKTTPPADTSTSLSAAMLKTSTGFSLELWDEVVEHCKQMAASIYTALRLAVPRYADDKLVLVFQFPLHQKKLEQAKNKELVRQAIKQICGADVFIESIVDKTTLVEPGLPDIARAEPISAISNIFGSAEVLEA